MHHKPGSPRKYGGFAALMMAGLLLMASPAWTAGKPQAGTDNEAGNDRAVRLLKVIPVPGTTANVTNGKLYSFDISWVDQETQTYYLADRSNNAIDVVDAKTDTFLGQIPGGFAGVAVVNGSVNNDFSGPNGVVSGGHCLFATDTRSGGRVVSFDLRGQFPPPVVSSVSTGVPRERTSWRTTRATGCCW